MAAHFDMFLHTLLKSNDFICIIALLCCSIWLDQKGATNCGELQNHFSIFKVKSTVNFYVTILLFLTDSEKFHEMAAATESPPKGGFRFDDESEFPPVTQKTE